MTDGAAAAGRGTRGMGEEAAGGGGGCGGRIGSEEQKKQKQRRHPPPQAPMPMAGAWLCVCLFDGWAQSATRPHKRQRQHLPTVWLSYALHPHI